MGLTYKSKAQSSCCQITIINKVDCTLQMSVFCSYNSLFCTSCTAPPPIPSPWYLGTDCVPVDPTKFNIQPGNWGSPSTTIFNVPVIDCPCVPFEFEIFGYGFTLTGNTWFDDNHTWEHIGTTGGCCPSGINVTWDPLNCVITIIPSCP